jgi:hypothetical protein
MRCKHQNGELVEISVATETFSLRRGKLSSDGICELEDIIRYEYTCLECKKVWKYSAGLSLRLKWLHRIHNQLGKGRDDE